MVTEVEVATVLVVTVKVALVLPLATVTLAGTLATAVLLLDSVTTAPPLGAAPLSVAVPCEELPPVTLAGFSASEDTVTVGETVSVADRLAPP
jgi:hypothetical protein